MATNNSDTGGAYINRVRTVYIMYNIILYVGIFFMVSGFSLFLYSEMKERQLDREAFMSQQLTKSFNKAKEEEMK